MLDPTKKCLQITHEIYPPWIWRATVDDKKSGKYGKPTGEVEVKLDEIRIYIYIYICILYIYI